jgi:class 3 adenylate cyclase/tetratricopeptide (TPR) repeat protein
MIACPNCRAEVTPDLRYCLSCGTSLGSLACPSCGAPRVAGARFCGRCGTRLDEPTASSSTTSVAVPETRTTERRLVSVLFADMVGFTSRSESEDPETTREFLTTWFERAAEVVERYGGTVEKFIGDAVMAVWGAPAAHEDDAERAVRSALDLVSLIGSLPGAVRLRVGVMTGEAAVTIAARGQGLVAGDLVNTSSRLQQAAPPGVVLVDETTMVAAGRAIAFEPAGELRLKGKSEPLRAWQALRVVAERGGIGRRDVLEPPFVGREEELRLLKDSLHAPGREGKARLVTVVGQAGLGKSRLAWELQKYSDGVTEDIWWHEGQTPAYGEGVAYWAIGEMVRSRCRIASSDTPETARAKLAATLEEHVRDREERAWMEPRLAVLLAVAGAPSGEREELFAAWRTFFERISERGTVVLIFEDLHLADDGLLDFIEHLLDWSRDHPILVVGLARPELLERRPGWGSAHRAATTIQLEPLRDEALRDMLRGLVPGLPAAMLEQVVQRAEGVPLYAVEIVRMLLDEGRLVREGERYRLIDGSQAMAVPASLQALVTTRLDALEPEERGLVQDAAVLGKTFTRVALAAVSGFGDQRLDDLVERLVRKQFVTLERSRRSSDRSQYGFVQGLLREVAYSMLSRRDRRTRHLAAAAHFESLADEELAGVVASHYLDAYRSDPEGPEADLTAERAAIALREAAERSVALHANAAALSFVEQALPVTRAPDERAALMVMAIEPASGLGRVEVAERYAREAIDWYDSVGRRAEARRATAILASMLVHQDRGDDIRALIEPILDAVDFERDPSAPRLLNELARAYMLADDSSQALGLLERGLAIAEPAVAELDVAELLATKAWALGWLKRQVEAVLIVEGSVQIAERIGASDTEVRARLNLSDFLMMREPSRAFEVASRGALVARRAGNAERASGIAGNQGYAALLIGAWDVPLSNLAETEGRSELSPWARAGILGPATVVEAFRGRVQPSLVDEIRAAFELTRSAQGRAIALAQEAMVAYASGRLEAVAGPALASHEVSNAGAEVGIAVCLAARAATWLQDHASMSAVAERLRSLRWSGEVTVLSLDQLEAAMAARGGRLEPAVSRYREVLASYERLGMLPDAVAARLEMLLLLGELPDRSALASEARRIISDLGAATLSERLDMVAPREDRVEVAR